ncbi:MAG: hypothetical protein LBL86_11455 [Coriobacteriales bacterium]|jgi:hypothetical protein|nr:hypothetical protein [Coriobacteriales bacterium]
MSATFCWQQRGCDEEMWSRCPHATSSEDGVCVAECFYTACQRTQRRVTADFALLLDPAVDRTAAVKENCLNCAFFLQNAPRVLKESQHAS